MTRALTLVAVAAALVAGCGDEDSDAPDPAAPPGQSLVGEPPKAKEARTKNPRPAGTEITVASSQFGEILFNGENQAIYLFDKESSATPECYGDCAAAWPPVLTDGEPQATAGAEQKLLGTTERDDGTTQVTYAGQPLYYYAHEGPGQVLCHNVSEFGGLWLVLDGRGQAL